MQHRQLQADLTFLLGYINESAPCMIGVCQRNGKGGEDTMHALEIGCFPPLSGSAKAILDAGRDGDTEEAIYHPPTSCISVIFVVTGLSCWRPLTVREGGELDCSWSCK